MKRQASFKFNFKKCRQLIKKISENKSTYFYEDTAKKKIINSFKPQNPLLNNKEVKNHSKILHCKYSAMLRQLKRKRFALDEYMISALSLHKRLKWLISKSCMTNNETEGWSVIA